MAETVRNRQMVLQEEISQMKAKDRAQDQIIIKMQLDLELSERQMDTLIDELAKLKLVERSTKEELSKAKLDQSLNIEEYFKQNKSALSRYGRSGPRGVLVGPTTSMQNRFLDFNKLKRKYEMQLGDSSRGRTTLISDDLDK